MAEPVVPPRKPCPICGKESVHKFRPFCSRRCADVDLNRWLSGAYAVPAEEGEEDFEAPSLVPESPPRTRG